MADETNTKAIYEKPEIPNTGLYDLIFTDKGFFKGGRYDNHVSPKDCRPPESSQNECPVCGSEYYDITSEDR